MNGLRPQIRALKKVTEGLRDCYYAGIKVQAEGTGNSVTITFPETILAAIGGWSENPWEDEIVLAPKGISGREDARKYVISA